MESYEIFTAVHVLAAVLWVGSSTLANLFGRFTLKSGNHERLKGFLEFNEWAAPRFFIPVSLTAVVFGVLTVIDGPWDFGQLWITVGLTMFTISFLLGVGFLGPQSPKLVADLEAGGPDGAAFKTRLSKVLLVANIELVLLYTTVVVMVLKPT
ncbi:MAG: DUF2269 family protein [Solirubrobacterales bacterium]